MGLIRTGSLECVTGQDHTDGSTDGSVWCEGGRWWSVGSVMGDAPGHQMVDYVLASTSD